MPSLEELHFPDAGAAIITHRQQIIAETEFVVEVNTELWVLLWRMGQPILNVPVPPQRLALRSVMHKPDAPPIFMYF